jgi:hypothetical protein
MKVITRKGVPQQVVNAMQRQIDEQRTGRHASGADYTVTELIKSPRVHWLFERHVGEMEVEADSLWYQLLGTAIHWVVERHGVEGALCEKPMQTEIAGRRIGGRPDLLLPHESGAWVLWDNKCTSVWSYILGEKEDWKNQVNAYRLLCKLAENLTVCDSNICMFFRDWRRSEWMRDPSRWPAHRIWPIKVEQFPLDEVEAWVKGRIAMMDATKDTPDDELPECTPTERWLRNECWAVKKRGGKIAMNGGKCNTEDEARAFAANQPVPTEIEHRPGVSLRCQECSCLPFCNQAKALGVTDEEPVDQAG